MRENGSNAGRVRTVGRRKRTQDVIDLPPGRYTLTEADHPEWIGHLIIIPR